jgi:hypothetical protein
MCGVCVCWGVGFVDIVAHIIIGAMEVWWGVVGCGGVWCGVWCVVCGGGVAYLPNYFVMNSD